MDRAVEQLTRAIASGDAEAFAAFYEQWFDVAYAMARRMTRGDEAFCLDVVQDVMLRVIRSMPVLESEAQLRAWLRNVVRSCACDRIRRDAARLRWEDAHADERSRRTGEGDYAPIDDEQRAWLEAQLAQLDGRYREPILLRFGVGWTLSRIGAALGLSPGAVDGRVSRGLEQIRRNAKEDEHG